MITREKARAAKKVLLPLAEEHDVGIGVEKSGEDYVVKVFLIKELPEGTFPKEQDGVKVVVEVVGDTKAFPHHDL